MLIVAKSTSSCEYAVKLQHVITEAIASNRNYTNKQNII